MLVAVFTMVAGAQYIMRKKLSAQSLCVREVRDMQQNLSRDLRMLLKLNAEAKRLRVRRAQAEQRLITAISTANPYAIALAKANQQAVILQQLNLRGRQTFILNQAEWVRRRHEHALRSAVRAIGVPFIESQRASPSALAVRARPASSLSPDYEPVADFESRQLHRMSFDVNLSPPFISQTFRQKTICAATLSGEEDQWSVKLVEANALSRPR